jgi:hypothetical protein
MARGATSMARAGAPPVPAACATCGVPIDAKVFDVSEVVDVDIRPGESVPLARFELPPEYCGVLEYFAQYTDQQARHPEHVRTPGLEWSLRANGHPLYPYVAFDRILNPWGNGSFQVAIRLDEGVALELVLRRVEARALDVKVVGGRIVGRYWYNAAYGDVAWPRA